ncbi:uncharacterized protein N7458_004675 [Penicillium daleae]|uniref:NADH:flavin oxidoreductase/NADH oxidase N-terminal domain-containing protein n=1 Tax=Penicillium daleae TaxID=63821 RepID=A0AAD6C6Z1_9EURO|nr:uncharacterized protein N7458_004675 [Penicillium daleae]KAJ5453719.1 hypothetical protein N7458_004675 [Penicillium daleae]
MAPSRARDIENKPAPGISYFTPAQETPAGTAINPQSNGCAPPGLFQPMKVRNLRFPNRIALSPLCQYSADDGHMTDWHLAHLGGIAQRGAGFLMVEATAVAPEGRISPQDHGLWKDSQIEPLKRVIEFVHSQGQLVGVQIAHAGRKASTLAPWLGTVDPATAKEGWPNEDIATEKVGGWPDNVAGPTNEPLSDRHVIPKEMTKQDIEDFKVAWVAAVKRAVKAGADFIEIHNAHGYLLSSFLSPAVNTRTDEYGGTWENRVRLSLEIARLTREAVPKDMPIFLRVSATDWLEESLPNQQSWRVEDTVRFAQVIAESGDIDVIDVSSGGNHKAQHIHARPGFQAPFAVAIKKAVGDRLIVGTVGMISSAELANTLIEKDGLDFVMVGRGFLKNPGLVWSWAEELGVEIAMASQIRWGFTGRRVTKAHVN